MPKIKANCQVCGQEFEYWPSKNRKFCSLVCAYKGREIPNYTLFQAYTLDDVPEISSEQEQVIWGTLLGDGSLELPKQGANAYLKISHSLRQADYLAYIQRKLGSLVSKAKEQKRRDRDSEMILRTISHPTLTELYQLFYPDGKKAVPLEIAKVLQPLGLAIWFLDDGSKSSSGAKIATCSFKLAEVQFLSDMLSCKFQIENRVYMEDQYPLIYIRKAGFRRLRNLITSYVPPSMRYKVTPLIKRGICKDCGEPCSLKALCCHRCHNRKNSRKYWRKGNENSGLVQLLLW